MNKITYKKIDDNYLALEFKLVSSILKTHYKELRRLASCFYDYKTKTGHIKKNNVDSFLKLVEKIEKSNPKRCATSHAKCIEKKNQRAKSSACDHEDLGSFGYSHGDIVKCPNCGEMAEVW